MNNGGREDRWARIRKRGRTRYIWYDGVLGFGLPVLAVSSTLSHWLSGGGIHDLWFGPHWLSHLLIFLVAGSVGGYLFGAFMWSRMESQTQR